MSINLPASRRWQTVGQYPVLHEHDLRIEFLMRWRDQEQAKHGSNQPPFQRLKEIALALRHLEQRLESISMVVAARDAAARPRSGL